MKLSADNIKNLFEKLYGTDIDNYKGGQIDIYINKKLEEKELMKTEKAIMCCKLLHKIKNTNTKTTITKTKNTKIDNKQEIEITRLKELQSQYERFQINLIADKTILENKLQDQIKINTDLKKKLEEVTQENNKLTSKPNNTSEKLINENKELLETIKNHQENFTNLANSYSKFSEEYYKFMDRENVLSSKVNDINSCLICFNSANIEFTVCCNNKLCTGCKIKLPNACPYCKLSKYKTKKY